LQWTVTLGRTTWHDTKTNNRGKHLEDYIINKQLHIMKEASTKNTYESRTGKGNIDLTIVTNNLVRGRSVTKKTIQTIVH